MGFFFFPSCSCRLPDRENLNADMVAHVCRKNAQQTLAMQFAGGSCVRALKDQSHMKIHLEF